MDVRSRIILKSQKLISRNHYKFQCRNLFRTENRRTQEIKAAKNATVNVGQMSSSSH